MQDTCGHRTYWMAGSAPYGGRNLPRGWMLLRDIGTKYMSSSLCSLDHGGRLESLLKAHMGGGSIGVRCPPRSLPA